MCPLEQKDRIRLKYRRHIKNIFTADDDDFTEMDFFTDIILHWWLCVSHFTPLKSFFMREKSQQ